MGTVLLTYIFGILIIHSEGSVTLTVPTAGNCGGDTVLTCHDTGSVAFTSWFGLNRKLVSNGVPVRPEDNNKYTETRGTSSFTLTIHNTDITDAGGYICENGFDESRFVRLNIECKASSAVLSVGNGKRVTVIVDKLYPSSPTFRSSFKKGSIDVTISGSRTCSSSSQYPGYYRCVWSSSNSLTDGSYTYSIVVTTITQADPLTGSFKIVSPQTPVIANTVQLEDNRVVVYGNEAQTLTIQCTSTGGYPTPTVGWYKDSVLSSNLLASTSTGTLQNDGTFSVTLKHTLTPTASDDMKKLILKPSQPSVNQVRNVSAGGTVEVRCMTTGSRPAAIVIWSYQGSTSTGEVTLTFDTSAETYRVVSLFRRSVTAADNGRNLQCAVTHPALVSPSEITASINLNIQLQASTTRISGNKVMTATGTATLTLTCTTGSSNPASDITWKNGSDTIKNIRPYMTSTGDNNGVVRSQQLVLTPTRHMDGDVITCTVANSVSQSPVTDTSTLNLRYSPLVDLHGLQQITLSEGASKQLSCKVDSKPLATITWYHGSIQLSQGTPINNVLNYSLTPVNRTHYGAYRCKATNGINPEDDEQLSVSIRFKPLTTAITGNNNIIANGHDPLSLVCTSGSSNPIANITWKINKMVTPSTGSLSDHSGQYGGMKRQQRLTMTPTRDNDGDIVSCEAMNSLGTSERSESSLNLKYRPLIEPMHDTITVEGNTSCFPCIASSKPAATFRWYRQGQANILHQGNGTLERNQLPYTIHNVRRTDAGTYRCNANNDIEMTDEKTVQLTVYYPPDVSAVITNTFGKALIKCNAAGIPNNNYKYGNWVQKWPGYDVIVREYSGTQTLELDNLTYEHSGVYSCFASNGVKVFGTEREYIEGSVQLLVKSYPIITDVSEKVSAELQENVTIQIYYYSNIPVSGVKCCKNVNDLRETDCVYAVSKSNVEVNLPVFTHIVKASGIRALIYIKMGSKDDFGVYKVVVSNEIGLTFRAFEIVPKVTGHDIAVTVGVVSGASGAVIVAVLVIIIAVLMRRKPSTKGKKSKITKETNEEMNRQENPVGMYEQLELSTEIVNRNEYNVVTVTGGFQRTSENKNVYEGLKQADANVTEYSSLSTATSMEDTTPIYENLKLTTGM